MRTWTREEDTRLMWIRRKKFLQDQAKMEESWTIRWRLRPAEEEEDVKQGRRHQTHVSSKKEEVPPKTNGKWRTLLPIRYLLAERQFSMVRAGKMISKLLDISSIRRRSSAIDCSENWPSRWPVVTGWRDEEEIGRQLLSIIVKETRKLIAVASRTWTVVHDQHNIGSRGHDNRKKEEKIVLCEGD